MTKLTIPAGLAATCLAASISGAGAETLNRISSFPVPLNPAEGTDLETETSAETIAATEDGLTIVYTDSPLVRSA